MCAWHVACSARKGHALAPGSGTRLGAAGVFPQAVGNGEAYLKRLGFEKASRILTLLVEADTEMKGGSKTDPAILLERLFVRLAG